MTLLVDAVIAFTLIEGLLLLGWRALGGRAPTASDLLPNLAAGLGLLLALRSVLAGAGYAACSFWLAAAGLAHAADLWRRWPRHHTAPPV